MAPLKVPRALWRSGQETRGSVERDGASEDIRLIVASFGATMPTAPVREQRKSHNRIGLAGGDHGGLTLEKAGGLVRGLSADSRVAKRVTVGEDTVFDAVEFLSDVKALDTEMVLVKRDVTALFSACGFRGHASCRAPFVVVEAGGKAVFSGCFAIGTTSYSSLVDNQGGVVMNVAWLGSANLTGTPLGEAVDAASPAWAGGATGPKIAMTSDVSITLGVGHEVLLCNTALNSVTVNLPPAAEYAGYRFTVKKTETANTVTVDADGGELIDGAATLAWTTRYESHTVVSDGDNWWEVGA